MLPVVLALVLIFYSAARCCWRSSPSLHVRPAPVSEWLLVRAVRTIGDITACVCCCTGRWLGSFLLGASVVILFVVYSLGDRILWQLVDT